MSDKDAALAARMERVYTATGDHIATVWAETVDSTKQLGESYLGMRDRTEPARRSAQQQTFDRARLFAAAPELLEALEAAVKHLVAAQCNARLIAIRDPDAWEGVADVIEPSIVAARAAIAKATAA